MVINAGSGDAFLKPVNVAGVIVARLELTRGVVLLDW
jgi:hypothetical protein